MYTLIVEPRQIDLCLYRFIHEPFFLQLLEIFKTYIQTSKFLTNPPLKAFAQALVTNELGQLAAQPGAPASQCVLVDLAIHLAAVLYCGTKGTLAPLQHLALHPANMQVRMFSAVLNVS